MQRSADRIDRPGTPLDALKPGDWALFWNADDCPDRNWDEENVIVTGADRYFGWNIGERSYVGFKVELFCLYNEAVIKAVLEGELLYVYGGLSTVCQVPGYEGEAQSLDFWKLGQKLFDYRTKQ